MINTAQLRSLIRETLIQLGKYSLPAENLLLGTASQESQCGTYIEQLGDGPARGIFQMEPATEHDIWVNYLTYKKDLRQALFDTCGRSEAGPWLKYDLAYQICMARIHYLRVPHALPQPDDIQGLAHYWKKYYNTDLGQGREEEFIQNYSIFL
jgi:hypothetical protein